jgi:hypothetical protein
MTNLKWDVALEAINRAIAAGAKIYLPHDGGLLAAPEWLVGEVDDEGKVKCPKANGGFGFSYYIANDYRLDGMYIQAQHFLMGRVL